jgi:hypothetical protein
MVNDNASKHILPLVDNSNKNSINILKRNLFKKTYLKTIATNNNNSNNNETSTTANVISYYSTSFTNSIKSKLNSFKSNSIVYKGFKKIKN